MNDIQTIVFEIDKADSHPARLALLAELENCLAEGPTGSRAKVVKSLLYHRDWYIRQEAAMLIDRYGIPMDAAEQLRYFYALQLFERLLNNGKPVPENRRMLFEGCTDAAPAFRLRVAMVLTSLKDITPAENILLHYARGAYVKLTEIACEADGFQAVVDVLQKGLHNRQNPEYHRKQCAFALQQLKELENAGDAIAEIIRDTARPVGTVLENITDAAAGLTGLERLIYHLQRQGIIIDQQRQFPEIRIADATRRITYRNPGLQSWTKEERNRRLQPDTGNVWLKYDYIAMEPTVLLHFLLQQFLISLADLPDEDVYTAIRPDDREAAKRWLNAMINGGGAQFQQRMNPLQMLLDDGIRHLRQMIVQQVYANGEITIISGDRLSLSVEEQNLGGKAMNRLIQGSASAIFNWAVERLNIHFQQHKLPARVGFLLFDEVWIESESELAGELATDIEAVLLSVNDEFGMLKPLAVRRDEG